MLLETNRTWQITRGLIFRSIRTLYDRRQLGALTSTEDHATSTSMANACELAKKIWLSGVDAVRAERLIAENVRLDGSKFTLCESEVDLDHVDRICVVGAGKAAGYLASQLVSVLSPVAQAKRLHGWVNVPENCVTPLEHVKLHAARPAGVNEPRPEGVLGTQQILRIVSHLRPHDLCICLITGGGSALLPAPKAPITLSDKLEVTKLMSSRGASIQELNRVRIALSDVKGGGLLERCRANRLITLVISDIIGDPLELIASGPTVPVSDAEDHPGDFLKRYVERSELASDVWRIVESWRPTSEMPANVDKRAECHLLANNQTAVQAAVETASSHGLRTVELPAESANTRAEDVATAMIDQFVDPIDGPMGIIWGGEPVVHLNATPGKGGRNQQLVLSAMSQWERISPENRARLCILSGGTDGEDGPTDAAGAFVDEGIRQAGDRCGLDVQDHLTRNDAYSFFQAVDGLVTTGPTHTNVCDLRVAVLDQLGEQDLL